MSENVKSRQPERARAGQARTRFARRAVVTAARALFLERGYAATTIEAISARSDVPQATVYRLFSSKLGILRSLLETSISGDDQPLAVQDRPAVAALLSDADPGKLLAGFAGITTAINKRSNDVYRVLVSAAASDPAAAQLLSEIQRQRDEGQGQMARVLAASGQLRPGLAQRDAADLIHALMSPEIYRLFVVDRQWTPKRYQQWLTATLTQQLTSQRPG
jgi:AcrR family transcriptional regulator